MNKYESYQKEIMYHESEIHKIQERYINECAKFKVGDILSIERGGMEEQYVIDDHVVFFNGEIHYYARKIRKDGKLYDRVYQLFNSEIEKAKKIGKYNNE